MRTGGEHEVGTGVDHRMRERDWVPSSLPEIGLVAVRDVSCVRALGAGVHVDDHDLCASCRPADEGPGSGDVARRAGRLTAIASAA